MSIVERIASAARRAVHRLRREAGAITAEYTLVTLVGATVALLLLNWAKGGALVDFLNRLPFCISLRAS